MWGINYNQSRVINSKPTHTRSNCGLIWVSNAVLKQWQSLECNLNIMSFDRINRSPIERDNLRNVPIPFI